jgi:hypothetical protein
MLYYAPSQHIGSVISRVSGQDWAGIEQQQGTARRSAGRQGNEAQTGFKPWGDPVGRRNYIFGREYWFQPLTRRAQDNEAGTGKRQYQSGDI